MPARKHKTPLQRAIASAEHVWGKPLVDVALRVARARTTGEDAVGAALLASVRERRRENIDRLADSLRAIAGGATPDPKVPHWTADTLVRR